MEGLPTVLLGIAMLWILADRPEEAAWLTKDEQQIIRERISAERREKEMQRLWPALKDVRVLILAVVQFGFTVGAYGAVIWLPQIIQTAHLSNLRIGFVTAACYVLASVGMIVWAARVDKSGRKIGNLAFACLTSALGLLLAIYFKNFWVSLAWVSLALLGITAARAIFWTIPTRFLTGMAAAGGLAFINSVGTIGGFRRSLRDGLAEGQNGFLFSGAFRYGWIFAAGDRLRLVAEVICYSGIAQTEAFENPSPSLIQAR